MIDQIIDSYNKCFKIRCPFGNFHYFWQHRCTCGTDFNDSYEYEYVGDGWWHRIGTDIAVRNNFDPHACYCVHHGGSPACEDYNTRNKVVCPRCHTELKDTLASYELETRTIAKELRKLARFLDDCGPTKENLTRPEPRPSPPMTERTELRW